MAATQLYRQSRLGDSLVEALDVLVEAEKITPELAMKVLAEFDASFLKALQSKVRARTTFRGQLDTYRFCDNVWTFIMSDTSFRTVASQHSSIGYTPEVVLGKVKMVCVDAKLVEKDAAEQQA
ncbi:hypothetical protein WJX81_002206 [Elliptochloris bilobata]|uniref:Transcription initiation factor IIA subunit 2 n=1 Tax=Elliptochloris bilobata TaxID=381761 RepID=A0AAW1S0P2_9CHLO